MIKLYDGGVFYSSGKIIEEKAAQSLGLSKDEGSGKTIVNGILEAHCDAADKAAAERDGLYRIKFDSLTSHDITYVSIIQTARASGLEGFPVPYVLTNCHNSLCAVGGTINEDDHKFALSAAKKYGGIYVPANLANIHSYNREMMAGCGRMILGSDSHTRYGALGCMGVGEGGGELVKQLLGKRYELARPEVIAVWLEGEPAPGVGPQDVALQLVKAVFANGYVKNKALEFIGPGIAKLPIEYRNAIDVMTTETTCWSSVWATDAETEKYYAVHGRTEDYRSLQPEDGAYYDGCVSIDLGSIPCSIALPMHPSNVYSIEELQRDAYDILKAAEDQANWQLEGVRLDLMSRIRDGALYADQAEIAGCSGGTFDGIMAAADILRGKHIRESGFTLSIYPGSMPVLAQLAKNGAMSDLISAGAVMRECFCGPCFGAGDCPANGELSIRHTTRNFPSREGSKTGEGQISAVALMDSRSIAATAINGGRITAASEVAAVSGDHVYFFDKAIYENRIYDAYGKADKDADLIKGPGIKDWPAMPELTGDLLLRICSFIEDPVTTTDELIPSGETASFRSDPERLSGFTLGRRDPAYVERARAVRAAEKQREEAARASEEEKRVCDMLNAAGCPADPDKTEFASCIFAVKPGDGSAREQAASNQRVLGGAANLALSYATKRYRSNCINWGIIPFIVRDSSEFALGDYVFVLGVRGKLLAGDESFKAYIVKSDGIIAETELTTGPLSEEERRIIADGCLINYYRSGGK